MDQVPTTKKKLSKMARYIIVLVGIAAVVFLGMQAYVYADRPAKDTEHVRDSTLVDVSNSNRRFALTLFTELAKQNPDDNLFFSPFSITSAMALTHLGAKGNTSQQMLEALSLAEIPPSEVHASLSHISWKLGVSDEKSDGPILRTANKVYVQRGFDLLQTFAKDTERFYNSKAETVEFARQTEEARLAINDWVEKQTNEKIRELIQPGVLDEQTRLVLINAIYFKGNWARQFDKRNTHQAKFHVTPERDSDVWMMSKKAQFYHGFSEKLGADILELPYAGSDLRMVILLPRSPSGLPEVEAKLDSGILSKLHSTLSNETVQVFLPKFSFTRDFSLRDTLSRMGMRDLFLPDLADLSGINGKRDLFVSHVLHKAFIEVNEEGSEAAAATAVVITRMAAMMEPEFRADHPFIFYIEEAQTRTILFIGRVSDPGLMEGHRDEL